MKTTSRPMTNNQARAFANARRLKKMTQKNITFQKEKGKNWWHVMRDGKDTGYIVSNTNETYYFAVALSDRAQFYTVIERAASFAEIKKKIRSKKHFLEMTQ